jgi:hypothetical protein
MCSRNAAVLNPRGNSTTTVRIYLKAIREHLEWMGVGGRTAGPSGLTKTKPAR